MNIVLCHTNSENNVIGKSINTVSNKTAVIKGTISKENPILLLSYNIIQNNINYIYIPEYNRYYFIIDIIDLTGGRYEIHCKVDVLESFKDSILKLYCIIDKQANLGLVDKYINDGSYIATCREFVKIHEYPTGFNDNGVFVLICAGG